MIPFHETRRGRRFFEAQLPKLITALSDIAGSLKVPRPIYQLKSRKIFCLICTLGPMSPQSSRQLIWKRN